jgi:hypothetical protein
VTVSAPPRRPTYDPPDLGELDALIEEARRHARRRRQRTGAAAAVVLTAGLAASIGFAQRGGGAASAPRPPAASGTAAALRTVVVTMHGYVRAVRILHGTNGPARYREAARFTVVWRLPASALVGDHTFRSSSAKVTGTTSALFARAPGRSCHGTLAAGAGSFLLRVTHGAYDAYLAAAPIGFTASPSPVATAMSASCSRGQFAARWHGRTRQWWVYNHPGGAFYGRNFTPVPKGGDGEGWIQGWGPAGSFRWLALFGVRRLT